jgi:hypothetical protein
MKIFTNSIAHKIPESLSMNQLSDSHKPLHYPEKQLLDSQVAQPPESTQGMIKYHKNNKIKFIKVIKTALLIC